MRKFVVSCLLSRLSMHILDILVIGNNKIITFCYSYLIYSSFREWHVNSWICSAITRINVTCLEAVSWIYLYIIIELLHCNVYQNLREKKQQTYVVFSQVVVATTLYSNIKMVNYFKLWQLQSMTVWDENDIESIQTVLIDLS